jgi:hypothetical protein
MAAPLEGGCHCRALRYRIGATPTDAGYCHCRICQLTTGAPVAAWAEVPIAAFAMTAGQAAVYRSSAWGERHFCGTCGAQILYRDSDAPQTVSINTATLDDPAALPPRRHIYTDSQISWLDMADDLPRHRGAKDRP